MTQQITKLDIRELAHSLITPEQWEEYDMIEFTKVLNANITDEQWEDTSLDIVDNDAHNGMLIIIALAVRLQHGWEADKALEMMHSKNLTDAYATHAKILEYLDIAGVDYDDDTILDICLKNLE